MPVGYDEFYGLHGNSKYYNYSITANGIIEKHGDDPDEDYYPNVIRKQAKEFLSKQTKEKPFMAMIPPWRILYGLAIRNPYTRKHHGQACRW